MALKADRVLVAGDAVGELLLLDRPLSFWGGVDPNSGKISDPRHPQFGIPVGGRILAMERGIGSSSGSSVLLELLSRKLGPAGIILSEPDAILTLGVVVAREMGYGSVPILLVESERMAKLPPKMRITPTGVVENV